MACIETSYFPSAIFPSAIFICNNCAIFRICFKFSEQEIKVWSYIAVSIFGIFRSMGAFSSLMMETNVVLLAKINHEKNENRLLINNLSVDIVQKIFYH